jgi:hypothetical protein
MSVIEEIKQYKYSVFKNKLRMGLKPFNTRGEAYAFIEEHTLDLYPEMNVFMMYLAISRRNRKNHTKIVILNKANVKLIEYDVVPETTIVRLVDTYGDFDKEGGE